MKPDPTLRTPAAGPAPSGLTPRVRAFILVALALAIVFEIIARLLARLGGADLQAIERALSASSSATFALAIIALVRFTRQGTRVRAIVISAVAVILFGQLISLTDDISWIQGVPILGGDTMTNSIARTLADYGGLVCLVLGFFLMVFDLDDAFRSLQTQRHQLQEQLAKQEEQEKAIRVNEARYRTLVEAARVVPWEVDLATWRFTYVGPHAEDLLGYPVSDWYAENFWSDHIHPDDRAHAVQFCRDQAEKGLAHDFEYRMVRADGADVWLRDIVSVDRMENGPGTLRGVMIDISEQRRAAAALAASERRFRFLYDNTPVMMYSSDVSGRLIDVNQYSLEVMGYGREEVLGRRATDFATAESRRLAQEVYIPQLFRDGRVENVEYEIVRKNGETFDALLSAVVADDPGSEIKYSLAFVVDISERKRIEQERQDLRQQMEHAQKLESLGVLAGGIAHDFNNLLMAIIGNASLALDDHETGERTADVLRRIDESARRGAELCRQMLAYSGRGVFAVEPVDLNQAVRDMGDLLNTTHTKKIRLNFAFAAELPAVDADAGQLNQVIMNLIINASEAIGDEAGVVTVSTERLDFGASDLTRFYSAEALRPGSYVALTVRDTGAGMGDEVLGRIFEPFFTTKFTGRGLGMPVVLGIVRGHGGAIRVDSAPGAGTTVQVILPASGRTASDRPAPDKASPGVRGAVLVADDEPSVLDVTRRILEKAGYNVITTVNGQEAVAVFAARRGAVAAVVLDMTMPVMSGSEAAAAIRALDPAVPIVMTSGYSSDDIRGREKYGPAFGYLQKPYRPHELIAQLHGLLVHGAINPNSTAS